MILLRVRLLFPPFLLTLRYSVLIPLLASGLYRIGDFTVALIS